MIIITSSFETEIFNKKSTVTEYTLFFMFLIISIGITLIILILSNILSEKKIDLEKISAYECGFDRAPFTQF